jgi:hypothetical protein
MPRSNATTAPAQDADTDSDFDSDEDIERTAPIDVTDNKLASALLAAWRGIHHFFKGVVADWDVSPNGEIIARGFQVASEYDPETILRDISGRERRVEFGQAYRIVANGDTPEPYTEPQDMTNFMVNFLKGSVEDGTAKTPEYVRTAVARYKADNGLKTRRGRKRTILRLDNLSEIDETTLRGVNPADLQKLITLATQAAERNNAPAASTAS